MLNQILKQINSVFAPDLVKRDMLDLNLSGLRAKSVQSNVFKVVLLAFLLLFTCGLVTLVVVRFLNTSQTFPQQQEQSTNLAPEKLLRLEENYEVQMVFYQ